MTKLLVMDSVIILESFMFFSLHNLLALESSRVFYSCIESGYYSDNNAIYRDNLSDVLSYLRTDIGRNRNGFYNASIGQTPDRANAIVLCRGDVELDECQNCVQEAINGLPSLCPYRKQAVLWYENCMLRYSNETIFGTLLTYPVQWTSNSLEATSPELFKEHLTSLLDDIRSKAINGGLQSKVAAASIPGPDSQTIFAFGQCTPDISLEDCNGCLSNATTEVALHCGRSIGCKLFEPSCNIRYEIYPFINETNLQGIQKLQSPIPSGNNDSNKARLIIIAFVSISAGVMAVVIVGFLLRYRRYRKPIELETVDELSTAGSLQYAFSTISAATNDFFDGNKLGQGGSGIVYKGILQNGQEVAVKRWFSHSREGVLGFKNEIQLLASLQHKNLVRLLGFSVQGTKKLLVYELVPNGSLDHFIFDPTNRSHLNWDIRFQIIEGIVKGLLYLHENSQLQIIHCDLKASNVLLDREMIPKIADFGVAKLFGQDEIRESTNRIVGTYGYMAPEYAMFGQCSVKSDVFSFGVLILEIISGKKNSSNRSDESTLDLLSFAWKNWCDRTPMNIVDPHLTSSLSSISDILKCIHIGLLCVQHNATYRPTMDFVVQMLGGLSVTIPRPSEPAFYVGSTDNSTISSLQDGNAVPVPLDGHVSKNDVSITEMHPR